MHVSASWKLAGAVDYLSRASRSRALGYVEAPDALPVNLANPTKPRPGARRDHLQLLQKEIPDRVLRRPARLHGVYDLSHGMRSPASGARQLSLIA